MDEDRKCGREEEERSRMRRCGKEEECRGEGEQR